MKAKLWQLGLALSMGILMAICCTRLLQAEAAFPPVEVPATSKYLHDRLLLIGTETQLNNLESSPTYTTKISRTLRIDLSFLNDVARTSFPATGPLPVFPPFFNGELGALRMDVVRLKLQLCLPGPCVNLNTVESLIQQVNADPNFRVLGTPDYVAFDSEWQIGANPKWSIGGSPLLFETAQVTPTLYREQFGQLREFGMTPLATQARPYGVSGNGVPVGIFDTSPFSIPNNDINLQTLNGAPISVTHYVTVSNASTGITDTPNISGHGAFVAGLINAVAPDTSLHLYRVLNDNGLGDEATLVQGLTDFISQTKHRPAVVNLSLGLFAPPTTTIEPLYTILSGMRSFSMTLVAAAGNDSFITSTNDAHLPAGYDFVIGVAAANTHGQRSCYSNQGDIGAPGGDGDISGGSCEQPKSYFCPQDPQCMLVSWWNPSVPPTMTASAGTSFATPFVSGAAALVIQQRQMAGRTVKPDEIANDLYAAALLRSPELGAGTLNLANLFYKQRIYLPLMAD